jgi:hypothetical protein
LNAADVLGPPGIDHIRPGRAFTPELTAQAAEIERCRELPEGVMAD